MFLLNKLILKGFAIVVTLPGFTFAYVLITVSNPLPAKYCAAKEPFGVKLEIPAVISIGVFNVIDRLSALGAKPCETTSPGFITLKSLIIVSVPLPAKYCAAKEPLRFNNPAVISVGVFKFLFRFNVLGVKACAITLPGFTFGKSFMSVSKPLPAKYCAAKEPLKSLSPAVISIGVFNVLLKFKFLGATASV